MKYSVVLDIFGLGMCLPKSLFPDTPTLCALMELAAEAGYGAVEFWDWADKDLDMIEIQKNKLGLDIVSICSKDRGTIVDASTHRMALAGFTKTLSVAKRFGCRNIVVTAGNYNKDLSRDEQRANIVDALKMMATHAENAGITIILEPISGFSPVPVMPDAPKPYFESSAEAFEILREVGSPHVKLLFDIFHQQFMEGNIINNIIANIGLIGHFHAAGNPGRGDITNGELNYSHIFKAISDTGYDGFIGLEYLTKEDKKQSLMNAKKLFI